jgi:dolichol-phosphate mannosyltransferase
LLQEIDKTIGIVVCDDSGLKLMSFFQNLEKEMKELCGDQIYFDYYGEKSGRGAAVIRGLMIAKSKYPGALNFVECDADESHRVEDVLQVLRVGRTFDFVIGSRYLQGSNIIGWPYSRRIFSKTLNFIIPRFLGLRISDITNGLRSYSNETVDLLLSHNFINTGFIMLSEIAIFLQIKKITAHEIPSIFVNRRLGKSTVTKTEIVNSLNGLIKLILKYKLNVGLR